jgi:hypothetical protein
MANGRKWRAQLARPLYKRHTDLFGCAPFELAMPHAAITENKVECLWDTYRAGDNKAGANLGEIEHPTFGAGAKRAMENAGALEHPSAVGLASIGGRHDDQPGVSKLLPG